LRESTFWKILKANLDTHELRDLVDSLKPHAIEQVKQHCISLQQVIEEVEKRESELNI
jgi:hypothetical protein